MKRKNIWVIIMGIAVLFCVVSFAATKDGQKKQTEMIEKETETEAYAVTYVWPKNDLTGKIPEPKSKNGTVLQADDQKTQLEIYKTSYGEYNAYVRDCRKQGFTVDDSKKDIKFKAHNAAGYKLTITYKKDNAAMLLSVDAEDVKKNAFAEGTYSTYTYKNFVIDIPNDWKVTQTTEDEQLFKVETDSERNIVFLEVEYPVDDEDPVSLDALYADNDNMINAVEDFFDNCKVSGEKEIESDYGVKGIVYPYTFQIEMDGGQLDGKGWYYCFPSPEDNRWFYVHLTEAGDAIKDDTYEKMYWKMLASIRPGK